MCQEDSLFYLSNHKWVVLVYKKLLQLGIHMIDGMMKNLAKDGSLTTTLPGRHKFRLCAAGVADSAVMQLSGHNSVQTLNHYKRASLEQEKHVSHLLSNYRPQWSECRHLYFDTERCACPQPAAFLSRLPHITPSTYVYTSFVSDLVLVKSVAVGKMPREALLFDHLLYWPHISWARCHHYETESTLRTNQVHHFRSVT